MKLLYEFIPRLDFVKSAERVQGLIDGWNITDSAGGASAPSGTAVACVLKQIYPDKIAIPMLITNYKGPVEIGAAALAAEAMGVDGMLPDPGDAPKYGNLIRTREDGTCQTISDPDEILAYRRSTGPAEDVRNYLRNKVKVSKVKLGCLLTARVPAESAIERVQNGWDFCFFLRLEASTLPKLKQIAEECKRLGKPIYPYFVVGTPKNQKTLERIGWPASATMENAEAFVGDLEGVVDGIIPTCLGDVAGDIELLERVQRFRS
jgi:5,10-methylenetetrahydrofolate reductase